MRVFRAVRVVKVLGGVLAAMCAVLAVGVVPASAELPDGRQYEMVTPTHKNGALFGTFLSNSPFSIAESGSRVVLPVLQCFGVTESCNADRQAIQGQPFAFTRTSSGWVASSLAPPATQFDQNTPLLANAETGMELFKAPTPPAGEDDFYIRGPDGAIQDVGPSTPSTKAAPAATKFVWATADFSHVVFDLESFGFWPFDKTADLGSVVSAYEYAGSGNTQPRLIGVSGGVGSTDLISICGTTVGGSFLGTRSYGALSADGSTVYFTAEHCPSGSGANTGVPMPTTELYARIDGSRTVAISQRSPLGCTSTACLSSPPSGALFEGASADGTRVYFTDTQQLTDDASEDASYEATSNCKQAWGENGCNLYLFEDPQESPLSGHNLIDVSAGDSSGLGPEVRGVMAISPDGSHVYFVANGVLTGSQRNSAGVSASPGADNLYAYERDATYPAGRVTFIASLSAEDSEEWTEAVGKGEANVTPDGRFLVFTSHNALTTDDTSTTEAAQVFRYDAQSGELVRISIGENGYNDNGNAGTYEAGANIVASIFNSRLAVDPPRADPTMSNDGSYVFFESPVGLTPQALNEMQTFEGVYAENIYEYHDGQVYLVSDGRDGTLTFPFRSSVQLLGSDGSGANVFFTTADQLVPQDTDTEVDVYDAHICSAGEPCVSSPQPSAEACEGEACHGAPGGAPGMPDAATGVFSGPGNLSAPAPAAAPEKVVVKKKKKPAVKRKGVKHKGGRRSKHGTRRNTRVVAHHDRTEGGGQR
jgi:hypothetical protein